MKKVFRTIKSHKYKAVLAAVFLAAIAFFALRGPEDVQVESLSVTRTRVAEEVSVTGRVVPAHEVGLSVQSGGRVRAINTRVGQRVSAGQVLLSVDSADLQVRLARQRAALDKARLSLTTQAPNTGDAESDLKKVYEDGFNKIADTFLDLPTVFGDLEDILYDSSHSPYMNDHQISIRAGNVGTEYKNRVGLKFDALQKKYATNLSHYRGTSRDSSVDTINALLNETYETTRSLTDVIKEVRNLVDYMENSTSEPATAEMIADQETLDMHTEEVGDHLIRLIDVKNTIKNSQDAILAETGDTEASRIEIRQAELDIEDTLVQINNRTIRSPIEGIVTDIEAEVGETISQGNTVISIISSSQHEIEANIPEADMAKVTVGAETEVTLDAYGSDALFLATVVSINPAETLVDGVATYRAKFQFTTNDERIKSGMTASLVIIGKSVDDVIAVPQRSVITKAGRKFVRIIVGEQIVEKEVETGLRGSDGNVEILSGVEEGERVVIFSE